jgi:hypothetical protein
MLAGRPPIGRLLAATALATLAAAAPATAATTGTQTASLGPVTATVTYQSAPSSAVAPYSDVALTITRSGATLYSVAVDSKLCGTECWPDHPDAPFLHVVDLNDDGQTEVVLDLYSGGAHCCSLDEVYSINPTTGAVSQAEHVWGDPEGTLEDLSHDGRLEFVSADDRFAYTFDAYAFSGLPIQIERFNGSTFTDVTDAYPALIAPDAKQWYADYRENIGSHEGLGFLAAWAADEDRLGHASLVARVLARENRLGHLRSDGAPWKGGRAYINELQRFLVKAGYR